MTRYLLVPGRGVPRAEHWLQQWADAHPDWRWAPRPPGPPVILDERVAALHESISADDTPAILVAHSAGCLVVATWAARHTGPVRAALLVAPPHVPSMPGQEPTTPAPFRGRLSFRSVVVASRTDPWATFAQSRAYAEEWGAELVDAGDAGHLDTASGYGPWPEGERLLATLG